MSQAAGWYYYFHTAGGKVVCQDPSSDCCKVLPPSLSQSNSHWSNPADSAETPGGPAWLEKLTKWLTTLEELQVRPWLCFPHEELCSQGRPLGVVLCLPGGGECGHCVCVCVCVHAPACALSCLTLWNPMDCSSPGFSVHRIFQARILEWVTISCSRGSSHPRDWTCVSCVCCIWQADSLPFTPWDACGHCVGRSFTFLMWSVLVSVVEGICFSLAPVLQDFLSHVLSNSSCYLFLWCGEEIRKDLSWWCHLLFIGSKIWFLYIVFCYWILFFWFILTIC